MFDELDYCDFRSRPYRSKRRSAWHRPDMSRYDRRQIYILCRSEEKKQQRQRHESRNKLHGATAEDPRTRNSKGQRASKCRSWCGKRGWLLMREAWEAEEHNIHVSIDVLCLPDLENCAERWDAAVAISAEAAKQYPAHDLGCLHRLSSVQYKAPDLGSGPRERLPALPVKLPLPPLCATETWPQVVCSICCTEQTGLVAGCVSGCHFACLRCWRRWVSNQVDGMRARRQLGCFGCFGVGCDHEVDDRIVEELSPEWRQLQQHLHRRAKLQSNALYPKCAQVDCPIPGCVGLGYLGHDTVMCFICEHQWTVENGIDPDGVSNCLDNLKACPRCREYIEKNGGCDHMTCRCGHEFWWSTLQPYRSS